MSLADAMVDVDITFVAVVIDIPHVVYTFGYFRYHWSCCCSVSHICWCSNGCC